MKKTDTYLLCVVVCFAIQTISVNLWRLYYQTAKPKFLHHSKSEIGDWYQFKANPDDIPLGETNWVSVKWNKVESMK
jgi:hypothetical protein